MLRRAQPTTRKAATRSMACVGAPDPEGDAGQEGLRVVGRVLDPDTLAVEGRAARLGVEEHAHDLRVLLEHVLPDPDPRELVTERLRLDLVPAGAETTVDAAIGEMVDGRERLRVEPGIPVGDAVDERAAPAALRLHGGGGH